MSTFKELAFALVVAVLCSTFGYVIYDDNFGTKPHVNKPLFGGMCIQHYKPNRFVEDCLDCQLFIRRDVELFKLFINQKEAVE